MAIYSTAQDKMNVPMHSEDACSLCMNELFLNPTMRLMIAVCNHKMCDSCVARTFLAHQSFPCPDCKTILKKNSFVAQNQDDSALSKENAIRRRILRIYNKRQEEFHSLQDYNDYLETVEDIIFNLVNAQDVEATNEQVTRYEKANQATIIINSSKRAEQERLIQARIQAEEERMREQRKVFLLQDQQEAQARNLQRIEEMNKKNPKANKKSKEYKKKEETKPTTTPAIPTPAAAPLAYRPTLKPILGAQPLQQTLQPLPARPLQQKDTNILQQGKPYPPAAYKAGGYKEQLIRLRNREEAFSTLFISPHVPLSPLSLPSLSPIKL